ncbi:hypothetical protein KGP17_15200 [Serratia sp. JSRIV001]|uniref:phage tail tip fiber protein n=1 Tax=Serratia sp. JSRIV001 TaxID=2831893 RepID=UPI001CBB91FE|nr:hypothetical protein [Serratia sp. JSRIV001]UAN43837.1 hypothetical protein KGP17_15200 [Serratia sp. JSRIV001]
MKKYNCNMAIGVNHADDSRIKTLESEVSDLKDMVRNLVVPAFVIKSGQVFIDNAKISDGSINAATLRGAKFTVTIHAEKFCVFS